VFDQRLVRKINQGRCFALVGSGPSIEAGYPSWPRLAKSAYEALQGKGKISDEASYQKYLKANQYPELFTQAERDLGGRLELVKLIASLLVPEDGGSHHIYDLLANWPFACYLTTNWDDLIDARLRRIPEAYTTLQNSKVDFSAIRHDASHLIVKLHSDLAHPDRAVITSADYAKLFGAEGKYFQDRLRAIFEMFDVLIVGHSLTDPDLRLVLQVAKDTASPQHPVFMIAADLTRAEELELLERFNVVALSYDNSDGNTPNSDACSL
jgi:SIR2-like protein